MALQQWSSGLGDSNAKTQQRKGKKNNQKDDAGKAITTEKPAGDIQMEAIAPIMKLLRWYPTENTQEEVITGSNNDSYEDGSEAILFTQPSTSFTIKSAKQPKRKGRKKGPKKDERKSDRLHDPKYASASIEMHTGEISVGYQDDSHPLNDASPSTTIPEKRMEVLKAKVRKLRKKFSRKDEELNHVRKEHDTLKGDLDAMSRRYEEELQIYSRKVKQLEKEKNDLLIRISSYAAARVTNENPCITDLSDLNRPTKISERYSELYDNHWTDAFQNLQHKHHLSETDAIEFLLDVLFVSFVECKNARSQRETAIQALNQYIGADGDDPDLTVIEVMKTLRGAKKRNIKRTQKAFIESVEKKLIAKTNYKQRLPDIRPYLVECVEICFLMNIQEPPLELRGLLYSFDTPFDVSAFKPYTKSGKKIEYVVWPAMLLHHDGPLLCKGIAQGMPDRTDVHKSTSVKVIDRQAEHLQERMNDRIPNNKNSENLSHQSRKCITEKSKSQYDKPGSSISTVFCMEDTVISSKSKPIHSIFTDENNVEKLQRDGSAKVIAVERDTIC